METIPYRNAVLTGIASAGVTPDYDVPGSAGTSRYSGYCEVYVAEEIVEAQGGGRVDLLVKTRIEVPHAVGSLAQAGDFVTYKYEGATTTRRIRDLTRAKLVGRVRLLLEDA